MRLGKHVQGKGIDLPVRSRRQTTLQVQTRTQKKERKGIDTCTTSIFVGLQVSSAAAARSCECVQWAADEGEPVER